MPSQNLNDFYVDTAPCPQNAVDLFGGEWASQFPPPFTNLHAGHIPLFQDSRLIWALDQLGGCKGQHVLELGPLEGGHSYILEQQGAERVTAVEANSHAFLKCLIAKEILGLKRVHFLIGDFVRYLKETTETFDLIVAAGVLYHMKEPLELIELLATQASRLYIWTHYYDHAIITGNPQLKPKFPAHVNTEVKGFPYVLHRQEYQSSLNTQGFCGGMEQHSFWLDRADILAALSRCGFRDIAIAHEQPDHPHGPCFSLAAKK